MKLTLASIALFAAMPLMAQQGKPTTKPTAPVSDQPVITELQSTKLELAQAKIDAVVQAANSALQPWQQKRQQIIQEILAANPGWMWHESVGQGDQARFVKTPPPPPPTPASKPPAEPGKTTKEDTPK